MGFDHNQRVKTNIDDRPLGKLLNNLRMESAFYTYSTLHSPWSLEMPPMANCMMFHLCVSGAAQFSINGELVSLQPGDFILFPKGEGHVLSDGQCMTTTPLSELPINAVTDRYETLDFGGNGASSHLICSAMLFEHPLAIKLLGVFPTFIVIRQDDAGTSEVIKNLCHLLRLEAKALGVGAEAVISRLADLIVITAVRSYLQQVDTESLGWLNALEDDRIGRSLELLHNNPEKHWSLEELANLVGMSRTSFFQQFKRLVGNTPMDYLTEWRMSLAYSKLQFSKDTILSIALDIGYQSESAFSRAFKKVIGRNPSDIRKSYPEVSE